MNRVAVPARQATQPGGIGSWESIRGLLKSLIIRGSFFPSCNMLPPPPPPNQGE
jgi:hypothetical protein